MNYLEIVKNVLSNGTPKQATRYDSSGNVIPVENGTIGTFCEIFRHDMSNGFPLSTLRKLPWKSIRVELEGFIKGVTDKRWFQERGCKFWDEWCNPQKIQERINDIKNKKGDTNDDPYIVLDRFKKYLQKEETDLGPIYGYQWNNFDGHYGEAHWPSDDLIDYVNGVYPTGSNQLKTIVDTLKSNPYDRRMVCSAWNPNQMKMMALPPCHWGWNVVVYGNKLNLVWHQRSSDLMLGAPANIASYALLLLLLCEESGLQPGELVGTLADCHIYNNLIDGAKELVNREEKQLPQVKIKHKEDGSFSIFDWEWNDVELIGYDPHPSIDMGSVTV